jgi:hypothetical protein
MQELGTDIHRNSSGNNEVKTSHKNTTNYLVMSAISKGSKFFEIPYFYKNCSEKVFLCTAFRIKSLYVR